MENRIRATVGVRVPQHLPNLLLVLFIKRIRVCIVYQLGDRAPLASVQDNVRDATLIQVACDPFPDGVLFKFYWHDGHPLSSSQTRDTCPSHVETIIGIQCA